MKPLVSIILCVLSIEITSLGATISVTDHGAVPDDPYDDVVAINRAIGAAAVGDTVYCPEGTYLISDSIYLKSGIKIVGSAQDTTMIKYNSSADHSLISMSHVSDVEIAHLTLDGNGKSGALQGIAAASCDGLYLHHLTIKDFVATNAFGPHGIYYAEKVTNSIISDNTITNIAPGTDWGAGIRLAWGSSWNQVLRNMISDTGRGGILCDSNSTDLIIQSNTISKSGGVGLGIEVWSGCDRAVIEDNVVDHWISVASSNGSAVRRNTVSDQNDIYKFTGLELAQSSNCVLTDNVVEGGAHIGISVSAGPVEHIYCAYNSIGFCSTWATQLQGDSGGATYHYFYMNSFHNTYKDHPQAPYSGQGHGFRFNGNCHYITLDNNEIRDNGRDGIQITGTPGLDQLSFINNSITDNGGASVSSYPGNDLEWRSNTVRRNGSNVQLFSHGFDNAKPTASFDSPSTVMVGEEVRFTETSSDPDGSIGYVLWDFDDGAPSMDRNPSYTYTRPGTYRVSLVVWDDLGRGARTEKTITVDDNPEFNPDG